MASAGRADHLYDRLTGLPNRGLVEQVLDARLGANGADGARGAPVAVLQIDVDDFRVVNDAIGYQAGDALLIALAARLSEAVPSPAVVSRAGADEFLVVLQELGEDPAAEAAAAGGAIERAMARPFDGLGAEVFLSVSIGVAIAPQHAQHTTALLRAAGSATDDAKRAGGRSVRFHTPGAQDAGERLALVARLHRALAEDLFTLHYQPIIRLEDGAVTAVEALIRWAGDSGGPLGATEIVPLAEQTGIIEPIGRWVRERVCAQAAEWRDRGLSTRIGFNVSARELQRPEMCAELRAAIAAHGLDPADFTVEITEAAAMRDPGRTDPVLLELNRAGLRLAIDDFGTGHSSLSRLREMPVHALKLDGSFLEGVPRDARAAAIVRSVVQLAHEMNIVAVAEGVDSEAQCDFLRACGCPLAQGYHLGRPAPAEEIESLLGSDRRPV
jgi:diguanylate cyclase (GGDEF)-like protein